LSAEGLGYLAQLLEPLMIVEKLLPDTP